MTAPLQVEIVGWLLDQLAAVVPGVTFDTDRPGTERLPWVTVQRIGGPSDGHVVDEPTLSLDCFTDAQYGMQAAYQLGYSVAGAVHALVGRPAEGAVALFVRTLSGPRRTPAVNENVRHVTVLLQVRIKTTSH